MSRYPGKGLTPVNLQRIREQAWAAFMDEARELARQREQRVRVVGVRLRPRRGERDEWVYVVAFDHQSDRPEPTS